MTGLGGYALGVFHHHVDRSLVSIIVLAIASAAAYGFAAVLQHHAAALESPELSVRVGLLVRLVRRPLWVLGNVLDGVGYLLQFLALRRGSLVLVEPLLVLSLVFALPLGAGLDHRRISASDVGSTALIMAGLGVFLAAAHPGLGHPRASGTAWIVLTVAVAAACALLVAGAHGGSPRRAAVLLGAGSGTAFGYVAALTESTGHVLDGGVLHTLASWEPYALVGGGVVALLLTQSAFNAGALRLSLPTLTVAQPLVAVAIGVVLFGEHLAWQGSTPGWLAAGLFMVVFGVFTLT
ncbi:MAG: DMT family transporter, partial [Acidimicrobiales bacterium]